MMIALLSILSIFGTLPLQTALNNFVGDDQAGCVGSINETLAKLDLVDAGKKAKGNQYEHNDKMPSKKLGSYAMLSVETKKMIREVYEEDYALFESLCSDK